MSATTTHPVSPTATPSLTATGAAGPSERRPRFGLRGRLVASFALLLLVALSASLVAARAVLLSRLDNRIDADLDQEVEELRQLASGTDPQTGLPLRDDVRRLFSLYLERNVPVRNEAVITYVDGRPYLRSRPVMPYRLDQDQNLTEKWAELRQSERGAVDTPAGPVKYLAVPIRLGDDTAGVYVAARFKAPEETEVDDALRVLAFVGLVALVVASALAAWIATRILRRVSEATEVAHRISETDLSQRLSADGSDELAVLAATLNGMLGRLQEAFESQRRFIDDVGHELRTPLTIVQGHLEQLEDDPQEREETLRLVMDELRRMGRLVGELLLLARAERPDFLDLDLVDLAEVTEELCAKAPALGQRRWEVDGLAQGRIVADRQRVTQAVMQLAENAVRQTDPDGAIAIGSALAGDVARIWVRDTGPGIPPEEQPHLFERFRTGNRSKGGSGLGLSIVRAIAEAHGGRVEVRSRVGAGATFTLALPTEGPKEGTV